MSRWRKNEVCESGNFASYGRRVSCWDEMFMIHTSAYWDVQWPNDCLNNPNNVHHSIPGEIRVTKPHEFSKLTESC